jgi:hypothetical protein
MFSAAPLLLPPLVALYPEIHYRFRAFPLSRYFRRRPEVIADCPYRLEPDASVPVLLFIKDSHLYPVELQDVVITARCGDIAQQYLFPFPGEIIREPWWHRVVLLELPEDVYGIWTLDVEIRLKARGRCYAVKNDNLPGLSHAPLVVQRSGEALPRGCDWYFGDLHTHSSYTRDHVEFGAPPAAYPEMGSAQGLSFAFCADHSYDLDDLPGSIRENDPLLQRFRRRREELQRLNELYAQRFALLPGMESTVANHRGRNIHLLLIGQENFLPGSGDSAERWFHTRSELSLGEVLQRIDPNVVAAAAHPLAKAPLLERIFLGRGDWEEEDLLEKNLFGVQIWNGRVPDDRRRGVEFWIRGLLQGRRWKIFAGSDAHGNFNRYRQVGFPMVRLEERSEPVFGAVRTGVHLPDGLDVPKILTGLVGNRTLVTNGPFAEVYFHREAEDIHRPGAEKAKILQLEASSSAEFGALSRWKLYQGVYGEAEERLLLDETLCGYSAERRLSIQRREGYVRAEVRTQTGRICLTNPIEITDPAPTPATVPPRR